MTPREIELLTIAKLEHEGHQLTRQTSERYTAQYRMVSRTVPDSGA